MSVLTVEAYMIIYVANSHISCVYLSLFGFAFFWLPS